MCKQIRALTGTAHVRICVRGGTTSSVVPPWIRTGGRTVRVQTWVVPVGARVRVRVFLMLPASAYSCMAQITEYKGGDYITILRCNQNQVSVTG